MKTLLLIEDNKDLRENTAEILGLAGYKVLTAENGKKGAEAAKKNIPDLIICDIMMPELDGYGVLHVLGKDPATAGIPFIFLTAKAEKSDFRKGMSLGADDYIIKPFTDTELLDAIEVRLKRSSLLQAKYENNAEGLNRFLSEAKGIKELNQLSADRNVRFFEKKQTIYTEGDFPHAVYFINKGKVKTFMTNENGKELATGLYKEGDFIGYIALLENVSYKEGAMALEDLEVAVIPREDFLSLLYNNRDVSVRFIKMLSNDVREKEEQLLKMAYDSVRQRVASALIELEKKYHDKKDAGFSMAISRDDLASIVGTATESLIRTLSDFREEKIIRIEDGKIVVSDRARLQKVAQM